MLLGSDLLMLWEEKQRNAVQTEFPNLPAVLSFASGDLAFARRVEDYFPTISFELEQDLIDQASARVDELRVVILSEHYAALPGALHAAQEAAKRSKLVILMESKEAKDLLSSPVFEEEWSSLALGREWTFAGERALEECELYLLQTLANKSEYQAVVQIDDYVVQRELGSGAQGVVYLAKREGSDELFAIKELRNFKTNMSDQAKTEIAIMKRLSHPNVTKLHAVFAPTASNSLFLVLEYVEGGALCSDDQIWTGTVPVMDSISRARDVFQQLVRGVSYLHRSGVLHRDIKPSNVLGHRDYGLVKLADFGVSSFTNPAKSVRILGEDDVIFVGSSGTPAFLPPEASGASLDAVYNGRGGDVWSLAVTMYVLLVGALPFRGEDRRETAHLICTQTDINFPKDRFPAQSSLHGECKDLLLRMLEKDPNKRITLPGVCDHPFLGVVSWKEEDGAAAAATVSSSSISQVFALPQTFSQRVKRRSLNMKNLGKDMFKRIYKTASSTGPAASSANAAAAAAAEEEEEQEEEDEIAALLQKRAEEEREMTLAQRFAKFFDDLAICCTECCCGCTGDARAKPKHLTE